MYLRLKRKTQTIFQHCSPNLCLEDLKATLAKILDKSPDDIRFYEYLTEERKAAIAEVRGER